MIMGGGMVELDMCYVMEIDDGVVIEIINYGYCYGLDEVIVVIVCGEDVLYDSYYMCMQVCLEIGDLWYEWVNKMLFVGMGECKV